LGSFALGESYEYHHLSSFHTIDMNNSTSTADGVSTSFDGTNASSALPMAESSMDYSSQVGSESYYSRTDYDGGESSVAGHHPLAAARGGGGGGSSSLYSHNDGSNNDQDATEIVHEMHLALLFLLSNPDEFKKAIHAHPPRGATTLGEWNAEIEEGGADNDDESVMTAGTASTPLPYIVFADDAEVVLPQAHTASQLFGIEKVEGIELEAAAGIPALSQLFLRWLGEFLFVSFLCSGSLCVETIAVGRLVGAAVAILFSLVALSELVPQTFDVPFRCRRSTDARGRPSDYH
jgi:hypothetical protein